MVPARMTRTKPGIDATPIATIAVVTDPPYFAARMIATSSAGKASRMSLARITNSDTPGRTMPARMPIGVPTTAAMPTATMPT